MYIAGAVYYFNIKLIH